MKAKHRPAFPCDRRVDASQMADAPVFTVSDEGMTLRDYFAAKALEGMLASPPLIDRRSEKINHAGWAVNAYKFADAMLVEREKKSEKEPG